MGDVVNSGSGTRGALAALLSPKEVFLEFGGVPGRLVPRIDEMDKGRDEVVGGLADCAFVFSAEELGGPVAGDDNGVGKWDGGDMFGGE